MHGRGEEAGRLRSAWYDVGGLRVHARVPAGPHADEVPTVVLVHGAAVSSLHMAPTAAALAGYCRVYAPDLPGHGQSDDPPRVLDTDGHADALAAWMDAAGLARVAMLGNSFGCQVITAFGVRYADRLERAVLQGPTVDPHARGLPRQLRRWMLNTKWEGATQPSWMLRQWGDAGPRVLVGTIRHMHADRIEQRLPWLRCPVLVVRGSRDPIVPQAWAEEASELVADGRLAVIDGETHTIVVSNPHELVRVALPFLRGMEGRDAGD